MKLCKCGCGQPTKIAAGPRSRYEEGEYTDYLLGHYQRATARKSSRVYSTAGWTHEHGHKYIKVNGKGKAVHRLIVEKLLGFALPPLARVHHHDENPANNVPGNLVVCENNTYHLLLHQRMRAYAACGHADWRKCVFCKQYDAPANLCIQSKVASFHKPCKREYRRMHANR